jgi:maltose alpha-D-glucosyltransferase/alpha-amylase
MNVMTSTTVPSTVGDDPLWFKDAIIYQLHVKAFFDANNDGIGDFAGLTAKLDYLVDLGVTAIWLLPFYPSPLRDDGYDIALYEAIHPSYGTMEDFRNFIDACHARGLRVITELVVNHTSDQHPWFQRARQAPPGSPERDFYVWSDTDKKYQGTRIIFLDTEKSNWTWDETAKAYYWHRFYSHQPDLNFDNPKVLEHILQVMEFWLKAGVDGMRLDAVPYLIEREGTNNENLPETHEVLRRIRAEIDAKYPGRMLLAEANQWPEDVLPYFGNGDECHMAFHFPLMPRIYMALAQEDRHPITDIMRQTPDLPDTCQWAIFLRNHDELTLEMVTDSERDYLWSVYANDRRMRINLGIRRRLAPLMTNDRPRIELMNGLLLSLPGTPVVYYGDEIGMGDNIYLGDRDGVRTPMQWSPDRNGGFSRVDPQRLYLPAIMDPMFGFAAINVETQAAHSSSLLNWTRRMLAIRKAHRAFGRGTIEFLYPSNRRVLAYVRKHEGRALLCVFNLSRSAQAAQLDLSPYKGFVPVELLGRNAFPTIGELPYLLTLPAYGFFWFVLAGDDELPKYRSNIPEPVPEFRTIVIRKNWRDMLSGQARDIFEKDALPAFLKQQRWFGAKNAAIDGVTVTHACDLAGHDNYMLAQIRVDLKDEPAQHYFMPLAIGTPEETIGATGGAISYMVAQIRQAARLQGVYDATISKDFALAFLKAIAVGDQTRCEGDAMIFTPEPGFTLPPDFTISEIRRLSADQSNSSVLIDNALVLKIFRRTALGTHPEIEFGKFFNKVGYASTPPMLGSVVLNSAEGVAGLAVLQKFVSNQGDGWSYVTRHMHQLMNMDADQTPQRLETSVTTMFSQLIEQLGQRTAELHQALLSPSDDESFGADEQTSGDTDTWRNEAQAQADEAFATLTRLVPTLRDEHKPLAETLLSRRDECRTAFNALFAYATAKSKTRIHGDFHLGQTLLGQNDWYIIDFEGEPRTPLEKRRRKHSPLKDVAGMLRSFDYATQTVRRQISVAGATVTDQAALDAWLQDCRARFLGTYWQHARALESIPQQPGHAERLLHAFVLEKACYELNYEAANRPDWIEIPIRGVLATLDEVKGVA